MALLVGCLLDRPRVRVYDWYRRREFMKRQKTSKINRR